MALPIGAFNASGIAGNTSGTGAITYAADVSRPEFYAGEFTIDTGYDDPVAWTTGVQAAEVYGARVYASGGAISVALAAGAYTGDWRIVASPVWSRAFYYLVAPTQSSRVYIRCQVYLANPVSLNEGVWQRLDSVDWTLYRV